MNTQQPHIAAPPAGPTAAQLRRRRILLAGCGNTGSYLGPLLARMPVIESVLLVDPDQYEAGNLASQAIAPTDVGQAKVLVMRRLLRRQAPQLRVDTARARVEDLPLGRLDADLVVSCVDSRVARQRLNEITRRLGIPLVDLAVDAVQHLARCNVYGSDERSACPECAWNDDDYAALETVAACGGAAVVAATAAPASLGAMIAGFAASVIEQLFAGAFGDLTSGRQFLFDVRSGQALVTRLDRNPRCRFDHRRWPIAVLSAADRRMSVAGLRTAVEHAAGVRPERFGVAGQSFCHELACRACGRVARSQVHLAGRTQAARWRCSTCGGRLAPTGFHTTDWLAWERLSDRQQALSLARLGVDRDDVLVTEQDGDQRYWRLDATVEPGQSEAGTVETGAPVECEAPATTGSTEP